MSKKRWICFGLLALLALGRMIPSVLAEDTVFFTAVNNTLLELTAETMPMVHNSMIYVPWSVFNTRALNTWAYYSRGSQTVLISDGTKELYFDLSTGDSHDREGNVYRYAAIYANETAYVPAMFTADYFGLTYSYIRRDSWHIVRLTTGSALSDEDFFKAAAPLMETRMNQYQGTQETSEPQPTESAVPPTVPPPTATPVPTPERSHVTVHLGFLGVGDETADILDALGEERACFFATAEEIYDWPDLTRRILGSGHALGMRIRRDTAEEYGDFCQALRDTAMSVSFLGAAVTTEEKPAEAWEDCGLRLLFTDQPQVTVRGCARQLEAAQGRCDLLLDGSFEDMGGLLRLLAEDYYTLEAVTEVTAGR